MLPVSDRQLLTRIVERWSDISDELKMAVLIVVGVGVDSVRWGLVHYPLRLQYAILLS